MRTVDMVAYLCRRGFSPREIAGRLGLSLGTVYVYLNKAGVDVTRTCPDKGNRRACRERLMEYLRVHKWIERRRVRELLGCTADPTGARSVVYVYLHHPRGRRLYYVLRGYLDWWARAHCHLVRDVMRRRGITRPDPSAISTIVEPWEAAHAMAGCLREEQGGLPRLTEEEIREIL